MTVWNQFRPVKNAINTGFGYKPKFYSKFQAKFNVQMSNKQSRSEEDFDEAYEDVVPWYSDKQIIQKDVTAIDMVELGFQAFEVKYC